MKMLSILLFSFSLICFSSLSLAAVHNSTKKSHRRSHQNSQHKSEHKAGRSNRFPAQEMPAKFEIDHTNDLAEIVGPDPYDLKNSSRSSKNKDDGEYYNVKPNSREKKLNSVSRKHIPYERVQYGYSTSTPDIHRSAILSED